MYIRRYTSDDAMFLRSLLRSRDMPEDAHMVTLPEYGYIAFEQQFPIAAGFIRRCERGVAMLDSYITCAKEPPEKRDEALDLITKALVKDAKALEIITLLAFSLDQNIIIRAMKHGFVATPHVMTMLKV